MDKIFYCISELGKKYNANKIILFGSRARGDNRERSDYDIAVFGMPNENQILFSEEMENLPTLLDFDIIFVTNKTNKDLLDNIEKDGKIIMSKFTEKYNKLKNAVKRLSEALSEYEEFQITSVRDGVIQRFEFSTELAWKSVREYLIEEGFTDINSPKSVMKQAYANKIINDEMTWIELLNARNLTSHIYDDDTAAEIFNNIKSKYLPLFNDLIESLK